MAVLGQLVFAVRVRGFYGRLTLQGHPERWNQLMPHGYVARHGLSMDARLHLLRAGLVPHFLFNALAENAVSHGIDPSGEGGRIDILVQWRGDRCIVRIGHPGVGLRTAGNGPGTGLSTLRARNTR